MRPIDYMKQSHETNQFSTKKAWRSFGYALWGWQTAFREEQNFRLQSFAVGLVTVAGFYFNISLLEWMAVAFSCGLVLMAELFNTALERLADVVQPESDPKIKRVKDVAAAGVLVAALTAATVGTLIFIPKIF